jgi:hypothetical protein
MARRSKTTPDGKPASPAVHDGIARDEVGLQEEIIAAQAIIAPHVGPLEREYKRACGKLHGNNAADPSVPDDPENWRYTSLRAFLAEVAQGVPECRIEARGLEWSPGDAYLIEQAVNAQSHRARMDQFASRTAIDFMFRSARAVCGLRKRHGRIEPFAQRLPFDELLCDPSVTDRALARWHGHRVSRDIDSVIAEAKERPDLKWNLPFLEAVRAGLAADPKRQKQTGAQVDRYELVYWPLWFPDEHTGNPDEGQNGTVHYVLDPQIAAASRQRHGVLREPEPFFGPEHGPYAHQAGFHIGESLIELAPLVASAGQGAFVNDVASSIRRAADTYKQIGVTFENEAGERVRKANNGDLITIPRTTADLRSLVAQLEMGGMQPQHVVLLQQALESLQRNLGMHSRLGDVQEDATATAINNAEAGYASTMGLLVSGHQSFMRQVFSKWAYWYDMSPDVHAMIGPLPPEYAQELGSSFVETSGSPKSPERHREMALRIDPMSTRGRNDITFQLDMQAAMGLTQFLAGLGPYAVALDVKELARQTSRMRGAPWIEKMIDADAFRQIAAMQIGQQQAPPVKPPEPKAQLTTGSGSASSPTPMGASMSQPSKPGGTKAPRPAASKAGAAR